VTLTYSGGAFQGKLTCKGVQRCSAYRVVKVYKNLGDGRITKIGQVQTNIYGNFRLARARSAGDYFAIAPMAVIPNVAECSRARSTRLALR